MCVGPVLGFEDVRLPISSKYLEGFGDVTPSLFRHLYAPDRPDVQVSHISADLIVVIIVRLQYMSLPQLFSEPFNSVFTSYRVFVREFGSRQGKVSTLPLFKDGPFPAFLLFQLTFDDGHFVLMIKQ